MKIYFNIQDAMFGFIIGIGIYGFFTFANDFSYGGEYFMLISFLGFIIGGIKIKKNKNKEKAK